MRRRYRSMLMLAVLAGACGRVGFDPAGDALFEDGPVGPVLACSGFAPALAAAPSTSFIEVALHPDGRRMVGRLAPMPIAAEVARASVEDPFGAVQAVTAVPDSLEDPSFATVAGEVIAVGANYGSPRHLLLCRDPVPSTVCVRIDVVDTATETLITDDIDGPTIGVRDGALVLVFSRSRELYVASPLTSTWLAWRATRIELPPGFAPDDPALTADAELLVIPRDDIRGLYTMRWSAALAAFTELSLLVDGPFSWPEFGVADGAAVELFFGTDSRGADEPHRATCVRR